MVLRDQPVMEKQQKSEKSEVYRALAEAPTPPPYTPIHLGISRQNSGLVIHVKLPGID